MYIEIAFFLTFGSFVKTDIIDGDFDGTGHAQSVTSASKARLLSLSRGEHLITVKTGIQPTDSPEPSENSAR